MCLLYKYVVVILTVIILIILKNINVFKNIIFLYSHNLKFKSPKTHILQYKCIFQIQIYNNIKINGNN